MDLRVELGGKAALCVLAAAALLGGARWPSGPAASGRAIAAIAALSMAAYFGFFQFPNGYVHRWEAFHYAFGAKYFPELGYEDIYVASLAAQRESDPLVPLPEGIRDLRSGRIVPPEVLLARAPEVRARVSDARWAELVADDHRFVEACGPAFFERIRRDHGFNATPAWIAIARALLRFIPLDDAGLLVLASIDPLLLFVLFAVLYRTFGLAPASAAAIVFGLGFLNRFYWVGGAVLRLDWLCATGCAIAALERRRFALAGALLGFAAGLRLFPMLFLFGPLVGCVAARRRGGGRSAAHLLAGFAAAAAFMVTIGCFAGRGAGAWPEFAARIGDHASGFLTNNVGLRQCVVHLFHLAKQPIEAWGAHMGSADWLRRVSELHHEAPLLPWLAALPLLALTALASLRASPTQAAVYGLAVVFALTEPTCYYYCMLLFVPLAGGRWATAVLLLLDAGLHVLGVMGSGTAQSATVYGIASWALLAFFVGWLVPEALATLRELRTRPEAMPRIEA